MIERRKAQEQTKKAMADFPTCPHGNWEIYCKECRMIRDKDLTIPF